MVPWGLLQASQQRPSGFHIPRGWKLHNLSLSSLCPQPSRFKNMKLVEQAEVPRILSAESALESARVFGSVLVTSSFSLQSMERTVLDVLPCALYLLCCPNFSLTLCLRSQLPFLGVKDQGFQGPSRSHFPTPDAIRARS